MRGYVLTHPVSLDNIEAAYGQFNGTKHANFDHASYRRRATKCAEQKTDLTFSYLGNHADARHMFGVLILLKTPANR